MSKRRSKSQDSKAFDPFAAEDASEDPHESSTSYGSLWDRWGNKEELNRFQSEGSYDPLLASDLLPFSATCSVGSASNDANLNQLSSTSSATSLLGDLALDHPRAEESVIKLAATVQEQISIIFDGATSDPSCQVIGSVHINSRKKRARSVQLLVRDKKGYIERSVEHVDICSDITGTLPASERKKGDKLLRVSLRDPEKLEAPVLSYSCSSRLKPMPLLIKIRVKNEDSSCRVSLSIRANPKNKAFLANPILLLIVPPDVDGASVQLSKDGVVWDELKRTLSFNGLNRLGAGETLNIHACFKRAVGRATQARFPVLMRCESETLYSGLELKCLPDDVDPFVSLDTSVHQSSKVMFRKV